MWSVVCFEVDHGTGIWEKMGRRSYSSQKKLFSRVSSYFTLKAFIVAWQRIEQSRKYVELLSALGLVPRKKGQ